MKFSMLLVLLLVSSFVCFSQRMITDSTFYADGKIRSFARYDSVNKHWNYYELYETGQIQRTRKLDPICYWDVDTSMVYHRNGKIAWIFPYTDSGFLNGKLIGYFQNSSINVQ